MLVPRRLRNNVFIRDNVYANLQGLTRFQRKELWRAMNKLAKANNFSIQSLLQHHVRLRTGDEIILYGAIIKSSFMAIVKLIKNKLYLLSVICKNRLLRSKTACVIVDDAYPSADSTLKVFAGVNERHEIIWRWEKRHQHSNIITFAGGEIVHFIGEQTGLAAAV